MTATERAKRSDALYYETVSVNRRVLCDMIANRESDLEDARVENDRLRKELDQWHRLTAGIELPEYPITEFKPKDLERENAKLRERIDAAHMSRLLTENENESLRELCADVWHLFTEHGAVHPCDLPVVDAVRDRMRKLGVEVDA